MVANESGKKKSSPFLNTTEAADYLSLSQKTLEKMRVVGGGPKFRKHGRYVRYTYDDLDEWSERRAHDTTTDSDDAGDTPGNVTSEEPNKHRDTPHKDA